MMLKTSRFSVVLLVAVLAGCSSTGGSKDAAAVEDRSIGAGADGGAVTSGTGGAAVFDAAALNDPDSPLSRRVIYFDYDSAEISAADQDTLLAHAAVQEVGVVGMPHEKWGEAPHAFVVLREGAQASEAELKQHVRDSLAHFKTPQWVSFVDSLPKTATGKIQKFLLRGSQSAITRQ